MIEAMVDGVVTDPQTTNRYLHNMDLEIQHLTRLIDNLFELAQLDAGHIKLELSDGVAARPDLGHARQHERPRADSRASA